ncbi:nucleoside deaminase [Maribacter sp. HTCC2170]|uniref:nucleoside deaminase n=1 Tax=Maribacter sp. (strain HTCC2170 / KCCM 42371) TaxID=313603 RepID=UPI0002DA701B|nr:nucleoside deaminase [Maribacter sp. HTCC2170]
MVNHDFYMAKCIQLAEEAKQNGNTPVGALIVSKDEILGIGRENTRSKKDITRHAEIEAIQNALKKVKSLKGAILYTTHEPCVMCSYVIRHYEIGTVVFGLRSKYIGGKSSEFNLLETENIPIWSQPPSFIEGVLVKECQQLSINN